MRYVIEITDGWRGLEFKPCRVAFVYVKEDGWPTKRQDPMITLYGDDEAALAECYRLWIKDGAWSNEELKANKTGAQA